MGTLGRRALALLIVGLAMVAVSACGSDDEDGGGGEATKGGSLRDRDSLLRGPPRPLRGLHGRGLADALDHLHAAPHLQARGGGPGQRADPRHRRGHARGLRGRQDLHPQGAQGAQVLRRHPHPRQRLRARGPAHLHEPGRRRVLLRPDRRRARVRGAGRPRGRHPGHRGQRQDRRADDQAVRGRTTPSPMSWR